MPSFDPAQLPARVHTGPRRDRPRQAARHRRPQGAGHGDDLERSFDRLRFESSETPALAHRLDKDTSGCLVLGRGKAALKRLGSPLRLGPRPQDLLGDRRRPVAGDEGVIDAPWPAVPPTGAAGG